MKVIFSDESRICIDDDDATFVCCHSNETKMTVWRKQVNFPNHSWYRVVCHLKDMGRWQSLLYQSIHICTLKWIIFPVLLIENWLGDDEVLFHNTSCLRAKRIKIFSLVKIYQPFRLVGRVFPNGLRHWGLILSCHTEDSKKKKKKKRYSIPPCLTLSTKYTWRVKCTNPGKGVVLSPSGCRRY